MSNTQWVIGKNNYGKAFYVSAVDKYGTVSWSTRVVNALHFENDISADSFRKLSLKNRTDVFVCAFAITYPY